MNQILYLFSSFFFVQEKDEYGNEVTKIGRPMPMEYFLIEVVISLFIEYFIRFIRFIRFSLFY